MADYTTIDDPSAYHQTQIYTGTGSTGNAITNDGNSAMEPALVWIKRRDYNNAHVVQDSTRGFDSGAARVIQTDSDAAEITNGAFVSFDTDGFEVGGTNATSGAYNASGEPFVAWRWKANGGTTTSATTTGGIASATRQVDSTSKFSIVGYTSESTQAVGTIEHGLGVAPEFIVIKRRPATDDWAVYHHKNTTAPETELLKLNTDAATTDIATAWNDTAPTSSVFTLGALSDVNEGSGVTYIAYLWAGVHGYSKFGSVVGNGDSALGPYVHTGFKPAYVLIKNSGTSGRWCIFDNKRPGNYNSDAADVLYANFNSAEYTGTDYFGCDFYANGFQLTETDTEFNDDDDPMVYAAFAESPFVTSGGVPATAR